jgi:hypothetical protein
MGLFSSGSDGEIGELIENANHDSVTEKRLTELDSSGLTGRAGVEFHNQPLIGHLNEGEQPHYIFYDGGHNIKDTSEKDDNSFHIDGDAMYCLTDERVLVLVAREEGDTSFSVPYEALVDFECKSARMKHRISLITEAGYVIEEAYMISNEDVSNLSEGRYKIDLFIVNAFDSDDIDSADRFLKNVVNTGEVVTNEGGDVSDSKYYAKVKDYLDEDEIPQFILRGKTVEIKYGGGDDDKWGKSVYTVVTNKRVLIVIAQRLSGNDTRSIEYRSIDGVNFEKGLINKELHIRAGGATYEMHVLDQSETKEAMGYIREQVQASQQPSQTTADSEPDPTEQLKNLKELHDEGVLSEEEFESKKKKLIDKI